MATIDNKAALVNMATLLSSFALGAERRGCLAEAPANLEAFLGGPPEVGADSI